MKIRGETNRIVFHHSLADHSNVATIREWHKARGFEDIGYHYVILKSGVIEEGRDIKFIGAHASGKNHDSIGICLEGDFRRYPPTLDQLIAAVQMYHACCRAYSKNLVIDFHRAEENPCPGPMLDREAFIHRLISEGSI